MKKVLWGIVIGVILLMLALYFIVFHDGLSNDSGNWGDFGSYIGGVGSLALSLAVFYYSYQADKRNKKIALLKQIEAVLTKVLEYNKNIKENRELALKLEIEIRTSFAVCVALAKSFGISNTPEQKSNISIDKMEDYSYKWLNYIENKTL